MTKFHFGVVEGGHDADPDKQKAGRVRIRIFGKHGKNVKLKHLPFTQLLTQAAGDGFHIFNRPPPPGTIMGLLSVGEPGTGYSIPVGVMSGGIHENKSIPGATDLGHFIKDAKEMVSKIRIPPNIKSKLEENVSGISKLTKEIEEKGQLFKQALHDFMPSHGSMYEIAGVRNVPMTQIQTALDQSLMAMSSSITSALNMGSFNLGQLLSMVNIDGLASELQTGLANIQNLMQMDSVDVQPEWGAMMANLVNMQNMIAPAAQLLQNVTDHGELSDVLRSMQSVKFIQDAQANCEESIITIETPFGRANVNVCSTGEMSMPANVLDALNSAIQSFNGLLNSIQQGVEGETLFSELGTQFGELIGRFKDMNIQEEMKQFLENQSDDNNEKKKRGRRTGSSKGNPEAAMDKPLKKKEVMIDAMIIKFYPTQKRTAIA